MNRKASVHKMVEDWRAAQRYAAAVNYFEKRVKSSSLTSQSAKNSKKVLNDFPFLERLEEEDRTDRMRGWWVEPKKDQCIKKIICQMSWSGKDLKKNLSSFPVFWYDFVVLRDWFFKIVIFFKIRKDGVGKNHYCCGVSCE